MKRFLAAFALLFAATAFGVIDDTFPTFAWRNPTPEGGSLNTVIYGPGYFMTAGVGGRVLTSSGGGTIWAPVATLPTEQVNGLANGASAFVAVGGSGKIFSSPDGVTWTLRHTANNGWWNAVTFADSQFVAVGDNGLIATSPDGTVWTARTSPTPARFAAVAGTGGRYVAVAQNSVIVTSADAITWTQAAQPAGFTNSLNSVAFLNGQFIIVCSNGALLTGTDGTNWTVGSTGNGDWLNSITANGSTYLASGSGSSVLTSNNLTTWTRTVLPTAGSDVPFLSAAAGGGLFTVVAPGGEVWTSPDGTTWTSRLNSGGTYRINDVRYLNGKFIAAGTSRTIYTSADAVTWNRISAPAGYSLNSVAFGAGLYVIAADTNGMLTSPDAVTWTNRTVTDNFYATGVAYGTGQFVAVGENGLVRTSTNGTSWTTENTGMTAYLRSVTAFKNFFVAVGDNGAIRTSAPGTNGTIWATRTSGVTDGLSQVRVVDGCLFALGFNRTLLASADGVTWIKIPIPNDYQNLGYSLTDIARLHDGFYIANSQGLVLKSTDLTTWSKFAQLAYSENFTALATDGSHVVLAGFGGTLMESALPAQGAAPAVAVSPVTKTLFAGGSVILSAVGTGTGPLTYQWKKGAADVPGATSPILLIPSAQTTDSGSYTVVVSGPGGSPATSGAGVLTVNPVIAPTIAAAPIVVQGTGYLTSISVTASGTAPLSYQWYHGQSGDTSNLIAGQTGTTYGPPAPITTTDRYWVRVTNSAGSVDSPTTSILALTGRNGLSANSGLNGVTYGNGIYVAAGWNNTLLSSTNGVSWTVRSTANGPGLKGITFGGGIFVAVGTNGLIRTSSDGITWATPTSGTGTNINAVVYDGAKFIAVGDNSTVLTSSDGATWTAQTLGTASINLLSVTYGSGGTVANGYVAVSGNGAIFSTADATTTWTSQTSNTTQALNGVTFANGTFVAVGNAASGVTTVRTSTDGITWAVQAPSTTNGNSFNAIVSGTVSGTTKFLAIAGSGYFTSSDAVTWSTFTSFVNNGQAGMNAVVFANNQWVIAGFPGLLYTSPDAAAGSWSMRNGFAATNSNDALYANGRYITAGDNGTILSSVDGVTYSVFSPAIANNTNTLRRVAYGNGTYIVAGNNGTILSSTDGLAWSNRSFGSTTYFAAAFGAGRFVVAGVNGTFATSPDGVVWSTGGTIGTAQVNAIEFAPSLNRFVAVTFTGGIFTSSDGLAWTAQTSPASSALQHVLFAAGQFVAVGAGSGVFTSPDGITWTSRSLGTASVLLNKVAYGDGLFVAAHGSNSISQTVFVSRDAVTWSASTPGGGFVNQFNPGTVTFGNGAFLFAGPSGLLGQTVPAVDTLQINTQPVAQTVSSGQSGTFNFGVTGSGLSFQWYRGNPGDTSNPVGGAISQSLTTSISARYWVRVTAAGGASVDSIAADLIAPAPSITQQPAGNVAAVTVGQSFTMTVAASSSNGTPTFQWRRNGYNLPGATGNQLAFNPVQQGHADVYDVVVSTGASSVVSNSARLTVAPLAFPGISKLDSAFNLNIESDVGGQLNVVVPYGSGTIPQILAAGEFIRLDGSPAMRRLARFNSDGQLDGSFVVSANGPINAVVVMPLQSGETLPKIVIGGNFSMVNGVNRQFLARLNGDGTLDNTFNVVSGAVGVGPSSSVNAVVALPLVGVDTLPRLLIGGNFTNYNGVGNINRLLRLNTDGTADGTFTTGANVGVGSTVNCIALDTGSGATGGAIGRFVVGGSFTSLNNGSGNSLNRVARFNENGTLDSSFVIGTGADNTVNAIVVDASSRVLIGGSFSNYNGSGSNAARFARLTSGGGLDLNFNASNTVNAIYLEDASVAGSDILVGGSFTTIGSGNTVRNRLARVSSAGVVQALDANVNSTVLSIYKQASDSKIVLGGSFSGLSTNPTLPARLLARVDSAGVRDATVVHNFRGPGTVHKILPLPDGKLLVAGAFTHFDNTPALNLARLNANLTLDFAYAPAGGSGYTSAPLVTVSGGGGTGAVFTANVNPTNGQVSSFSLVAGGSGYTSAPTVTVTAPAGGGVAARAIALFNGSGAVTAVNLDSSLAGPSGTIRAAVVEGPGRIVIGGQFSSFNGTNVTRLARLNADLTLDPSFNAGGAGANGDVNAIVAIPGGGYYIGGSFSNYNNASPTGRASVARVFSDGTLDLSFNGGTTSYTVNTLALQGDGKLVVGGNFGTTTINGQSRANILRFSPDGSVDAVMTSTSTGGQVRALLVQPGDAGEPNGRILVGGDFTNILGVGINRLARVKGSDGTVDASFAINPALLNNGVYAFLRQEEPAGRVIAWGNYNNLTVAGGLNNSWLTRVNADGSLDPTLELLGTNLSNNLSQPSALHVLDDGTLLIGTISVTLSGQERTGLLHLVATTPPTVIALSANDVRPGATITLTGTDFTEVAAVRFGGANGAIATNFTVNSPTSITVVVPPLATSGPVFVQTAYGTAVSATALGIAPDFQLRNPAMTAGSLENLAFGNSTYVIAATSGSIWSSTDGASWTKRFAGPNGLNGVTFAASQFVAVGNNGTIVTSPDGLVWTPRPLVGTNINLNAAAHDGTRWVVVTGNTTVVTSTDGVNWNFFTAPTGGSANGLAYGAGLFVSVSGSGVVRTSSDGGLNWTPQTSNAGSDNLNDVVFVSATNTFLAGGANGRLITSPDGITWTSRTSGSTSSLYTAAYGVISGTGKYIMGVAGGALVSTDLATWTSINGSTSNTRGMLFANGQFVSGGNQGNLGTTPDGATNNWTLRASGGQRTWRDFAYGAGRYVGVGDGAQYVNSVDGATFVIGANAAGSSANLNGIAYGNGQFVAVGSNAILTTPDGVTWTVRTSPSGSPTMNSVAFGGGVWVAVASSGNAYRSTDGITFTLISTGNGNSLNNVTYGGSPAKFVAVGASNGTNGTVLTSTDGTSWTAQVSNAGNNTLNGVTFAAGKFVALGSNSALVTSPDGVTWTARTFPVGSQTLTRVAFGDGFFVAVANTSNTFFTSTDGITWTAMAPSLENFNSGSGGAITYGNGHFVVGAGIGFLASTNPASDTTTIATQPAGANFNSGQSVTLNVGATGTGLTYQWYNGFAGDTSSPVAGQTGSTFNTGALSISSRFWVRVTDGSGASVDSTTTTLLGPPAITTQPIAQTVNEGSNVTFTVAGFGPPTLAYQWKKGGVDVSGTNVSGATTATLTITGVTAAQAGLYSVVVSNSAGSTPSNAVALAVTPVVPTIAQQSTFGQGVIVQAGSNVDLQMNVSGTQPIAVQWKKNGVNVGAPVVPDALGIAHLFFLGIQPSEAGPYTAIATNALGSSAEVTNNQAQFVVNQPTWTWRQPFPTPVTLSSVAVAPDGGFMLFGNRGYFADSEDGQIWDQLPGFTTQTANGYAFGNNRHLFWASQFFATADASRANLVKSHLPTFETVNEVVFGQGVFVAICNLGKIFTSPDGITWTERTSNTTENIFEATFGNGTFVASTATGQIITSADGITWSAPHASGAANAMVLRYAKDRFYLGNSTGQLFTSLDGTTWTIGTNLGTQCNDLTYWADGTGDHFVIVGNGGFIRTSINGVAFTAPASVATSPTNNLISVKQDNGNVIAIASTLVLRSTNKGVDWAKQNGGNTINALNGVTSSATALVAVGNGGVILRSGFTAPNTAADTGWGWQTSTNSGSTSNLNEVTYAGTTFYAVGSGGTIRTSTDDGLNWTGIVSGSSNLFWVGSLKGQIFATGASGTLLSFNGTTWNTVANGSSAQLNGAAYGALAGPTDAYVLVGSGGTILSSSTGAASSWTATTSGTANLNEVAFGNGAFVAVGDAGTILRSTNGTSWTSTGFGLPENFTHVGYTGGIFIVSGCNSGTFTSPDGITWTARLGGTNSTAFVRATSAAFGGRVYGVGQGGAILGADLIPQGGDVAVGTPVAGGPATFRAYFFEPLLPLTFQWNRGGLPISGATSPTYTIPNATRADAGSYSVTLTTAAGATASDQVLFSVAPTAYPGVFAADPTYNPDPITLSSRVYAAAKLSGGKWLAGGDFTQWDNQPRYGLTRLNTDLSLDLTYTPPVINGYVHALAVGADGFVYVGGDFTAVDGHIRNGIARLTSTLALDLTWQATDNAPNSTVTALAVLGDGRVYVARTSFGNGAITGTNVLRRLNAAGSLDGGFNVNITIGGGRILNMLGTAANGVIIGGQFSVTDAAATPSTHQNIARLDSAGAVDTAFGGATGTNSFAAGTVLSLSEIVDGVNPVRYLVGGQFTTIGGQTRNHLAILDSAGTVDAAFVPAAGSNGNVYGATALSDGRIVAGGSFSTYGGSPTFGLIRLTTAGAVDLAYTVGAVTPVSWVGTTAGRNLSMFTLPGNDVALFGVFSGMLNQRRVGLAVIKNDGTLAATPAPLVYHPAYNGSAYIEANGKLTAYGSIDLSSGVSGLGQAVRLNTNGSLDNTYPQGSGFGLNGLSTFGIYRAVRQGDGKTVVVGDLASYNGTPTGRLFRVNADGSLDNTFAPGTPSTAFPQILPLTGGKVLLYGLGAGYTYNGTAVNAPFLRLNANGTVDSSLNLLTGFDGNVSLVTETLDGDGSLVVTGSFTHYRGQPVPGIVVLAPDGTPDPDTQFGTGANGQITGLTFARSLDRVVFTGNFTSFNGVAANRIAFLNPGADLAHLVDSSFTAAAAIDGTIGQVLVQEDGKLIVVGEFSSGLAIRLNSNGTVDPTFALLGITGFPGTSASGLRIALADNGDVTVYNGQLSIDNGPARSLVRFHGAPVAPVIAVQPASGGIIQGVNNLLWVRAGGTGPYTYQWFKGANPIAGAVDSVLIIPNATLADVGNYRVQVTGPGGSTSSATATLSTTVTIADHPSARRAVAGGKVQFRVSGASTIGGATLTYVWRKDGNPISGATASDLTLSNLTSADAGTYSVVVGDGTNTLPSQSAALTVLTPDNILWQQFSDVSTEESPARTIHDGSGKVYVPWSVQSRIPDVVGGRLVGALARLNEADGTLDTSFKLDRRFQRASHAAVQSDGKVVVAVSVGDANTVVRVSSTGVVDGSFNAPLFVRGIRFITLQSDGKVLVTTTDNANASAPATAIGGDAPSIYRLNSNGTLDGTFTRAVLNATANIFGPPVVDGSGNVYLAGTFSTVNGTSRINIARLGPTGTLDANYAVPANLPAGFASAQARGVAFQGDGRAIFVGDFRSTARGTQADSIMAIRFSTAGAFDATFNQPLRSTLGLAAGLKLRYLLINGDDKILAISSRFLRLNADGSPDGTFVSRGVNKESFWISRGADGRIYAPDQNGVFGQALMLPLWANGIARFAADGTPDDGFQTGGWGRSATAQGGVVLSDGRVWVNGNFNRYGSKVTPGVAQFNADGTLSATQAASTLIQSYGALTSAGGDQVFVILNSAGNSTEPGASFFRRLNADATIDGTFNPVFPANYGSLGSTTLAASPGGKVLVYQENITAQAALAGTTGDALFRMNANGTRDTGFNAASLLSSFAVVERGAGNAVTMIRTGGVGVAQVLPDGRAIVGSVSIDGSLKIVRLLNDGTIDPAFTAPSFGTITPSVGFTTNLTDPVTGTTTQFNISTYDSGGLVRTALQTPDGKVYVGGRFLIAGSPRGLVRLNANGTLDTSFTGAGIATTRTDIAPSVDHLAVDSLGRVYVAGLFESFNGAGAPGLVRLRADGTVDTATAWFAGLNVLETPFTAVRLVPVGAKLYLFGSVGGVSDVLPSAYRVTDIPPPPSITTPPTNGGALAGGNVTFTVAATGTGPITYQWFKGANAISGATAASYTINGIAGGDVGSYSVAVTGPGGTTTSAPATLSVLTVPVIVTQPQSQAASTGEPFALTVVATGSATLNYQWSKDGTPISGATSATYNVASAIGTGTGSAGFGTTGDGGDYTVHVSNTVGSADSSPAATVVIVPPNFRGNHAVVGAGYLAGSTVTITNTFTYSGSLGALGWQVLLPTGWSFAAESFPAGASPASSPSVNQTGVLEWAWITAPASGTTFTYTLNVPANATGQQTIAALYLPRQNGTPYTMLAKPDPLLVDPVTYHSADTNHDFKISLTELLRVIELYNTRNGTTRTGAYIVATTTTEDGFASDPSRSAATVVTLAFYHSGDSNHDAKLSLTELLRVIELYNHRTGTTRDGLYHVQAGTEDNFATGP